MIVVDWQTRRKLTPEPRRRALYVLNLRRHDRINSWDLVDRAAQHVVGGWLREIGKRNPDRLVAFLDRYAADMLTTTRRYATDYLEGPRRDRYRSVND